MPLAELKGDRIIVTTSWNEKEVVKAIPGSRWDATNKEWTVPLTMPACSQLKGSFFNMLEIGPLLTQWIWDEYNGRVKPSMLLRSVFDDKNIHIDPRLYDFQQAGVAWLCAAGSGLLGDEMGTGKTIQVLTAMRVLQDEMKTPALPALVIAPNSVKANWAKEAAKWLPMATPYVLTGSASVKAKLLAAAAQDPTALVVTNFESTFRLSRLAGYGSIRLLRCKECDKQYGLDIKPAQCEVHPRPLNAIPFRTVVVDEAHRIKDPKAKQTRATWALAAGNSVVRRWALTGTPLANDPSDLWSIMRFVDEKEYPTKSKFVDRYCLQAWNNHGGLDVVGVNPTHKEEFFKIFDPRFRRMPKALVLTQLPPKIRQTRLVEMTPKQKKAYNEISKQLGTRLEDGTILVAKSDLTAQIRLLQLASSYCTVDDHGSPDPRDWDVFLAEPSPKVDELMVILEELGDRPVVVAAEQRKIIELAAGRLEKAGISYGLITGAVDAYDRQLALEAFQAGKLRALLFTLKAGGTGLTMTAADTMIRLQRSWSMIDNMQGEDRIHRIGSEIHETINIIDIITEGTVEETQVMRLYEKQKRLEEITRDRATLLAAGKSIVHLDEEENKIMNSFLGEPE